MAELNGIKGLKCRRADTHLSEEQLKEIADLIYDSDPYIYPAMFTNRREAETVIPKMIRAGDPMFRRENLFVALAGPKVVGVLLWIRGPLAWNKKIYEKCGGKAKYIDRVAMEYFDLFAETLPDTVSLVRISVKKELRGNKTGSMLMETFLEAEKGSCQLYVLANNMEAVHFFQEKGFRIRETRPGFSLDYQALPCYWMVKKSENDEVWK